MERAGQAGKPHTLPQTETRTVRGLLRHTSALSRSHQEASVGHTVRQDLDVEMGPQPAPPTVPPGLGYGSTLCQPLLQRGFDCYLLGSLKHTKLGIYF